jgi:hypothetical protein
MVENIILFIRVLICWLHGFKTKIGNEKWVLKLPELEHERENKKMLRIIVDTVRMAVIFAILLTGLVLIGNTLLAHEPVTQSELEP